MKNWLAIVPALWLVACGGETPPADEQENPGAFDELTGTLDRAEAVEDTVMQQKERLDRAIDDAEADDPERGPRN